MATQHTYHVTAETFWIIAVNYLRYISQWPSPGEFLALPVSAFTVLPASHVLYYYAASMQLLPGWLHDILHVHW